MRFDHLSLRGLGPFHNQVDIDLAAIPGVVIAVTGDNGAGKSTLLELLPGAIYRQTPTRGSLVDLATERGAFVEARVVNGATYTLRHTVDAVSGKGESVVLDAEGSPVLGSAKVRDFDLWRTAHLPPPEVLYASSFAPQGSGGFLEMKAGDRKGVLLRVLGVEALEQKAERARERQRSARQTLEVLDARIADERSRGGDVGVAEEQIATARRAAVQADQVLAQARTDLGEVDRRLAEIEKVRVEVERVRRARTEHVAQVAAAEKKVTDLEVRCANNRTVLMRRAEIETAVRRDTELGRTVEELRTKHEEATRKQIGASKDAEAAKGRAKTLTDQRSAAKMRVASLQTRLAKATEVLKESDSIAQAIADLPRLQGALDAAVLVETEASRALDEARRASLGVAERRIDVLRPAVEEISGMDERCDAIVEAARDALVSDDAIVKSAKDAPAEVAATETRLGEARELVRRARDALTGAKTLAARVGEMSRTMADSDAATEESRATREEVARLEQAVRTACHEEDEAAGRLREARTEASLGEALLADAETERGRLAPLVARAAPLAQAEARLAELEPELASAQGEVRRLTGNSPPAEPALPHQDEDLDRDYARSMVESAEQEARHAHSMISVAEARLESARLAEQKLGELRTEHRAASADLADWVLLAESLGRDGIQALEVDAAGPELTELINDLLQTCVGSRWTVTIETTKASADGKKQLEGCEVRVLDTERGRDASAETLSGGERVLVGEAVSLALSMLACRRAGVDGPTLVRDESGAALDPANARGYVAMLRRAAQVVGASHVLFVSHSKEVQELADARIEIANGTVRVAA